MVEKWVVMDRIRAGAAGLTLALTVTACGSSDPANVSTTDPGIGHVHGLGVDPGDGSVYVAAHYGLFKLTSVDTALRVAGRVQDHMGFTITGPKTFLASGHPSADAITPGGSPHLGLIRSTDAGATWTTVSEGGVADFHALQVVGDSLYAYDSQTGTVRRSGDGGATWLPGTESQVLDLGGNAAEPDSVYATTLRGIHRSTNGGLSFSPMKNTPLLSHIESPGKGVLVGPAADGRIHLSRDAGKTWTPEAALPEQATAFTAVNQQRMLAAMENGTVLESRNGGRDFTVIFRPATS
ncbi:F510_1955 family glycosylhydrolase [Nonomuraea endophytica]|uniref:F510_1955 family glycosylhydrolase n=1 Tax=Nonomuraea endophytica TaxID=714136 RepID=UPI0037C5557E